MIKKDKGLTAADATPLVSMVSTRKSSINTGDVSSMSSNSDEDEIEGDTQKARGLQTYSIPGSLLVAGAMPLTVTLQHCTHPGSVIIFANPIN
jgi:hypothetical protein